MNEYVAPNSFYARGGVFVFPCYLQSKIYEVDHPWGISSHGELLGGLTFNFRSCNLRGALQCDNSVVRLARNDCQSMYICF